MTTSLSCTFHVDVDGILFSPIWTGIEEVMHAQTLAVPGATPMPLMFQDIVP